MTRRDLTFTDITPRIRALRYLPWTAKQTANGVPDQRAIFSNGTKGPDPESIRLWIHGAIRPSARKLQELCEVFNEQLGEPLLSLELLSDSTTYPTFLKTVGLDPGRIHEPAFSAWAHESRLCRSFTFDTQALADAFERKSMRGLYRIARRRLGGKQKVREVLAMVVYGPVPASLNRNERRHFVPCELTIRSQTGGSLFWYRGVVGPLDRGLEWRFFQEGSENLDRIDIMTDAHDPREDRAYVGALLTLAGAPQFQPMTCVVSIDRVGDLRSADQNYRFLEETPAAKTGRTKHNARRAGGSR